VDSALFAEQLLAFHAATPASSTSKTAAGVLNSTRRALRTSFSGSQDNVQGSKKIVFALLRQEAFVGLIL
jgi:hypothetical protein